jgi:hypothetical protein
MTALSLAPKTVFRRDSLACITTSPRNEAEHDDEYENEEDVTLLPTPACAAVSTYRL